MSTTEQTAVLADAVGPSWQASALGDRVAADGVRFILATFVDLNGKPCAKLVPVQALDMLETEGVGFAGYAAGPLGQTPADPDLIAIPDASSYTPLPFVRPDLAMVQCDLYVEGKLWPFSPRVILRTMLDRLAQRGLTLQVGAEAEYFLVKQDQDGRVRIADERDTAERPCYDARGLTRMYEHLTDVSTALNRLGWSNYANDHEDGNGQFEQNFTHADALVTADRLVAFRYLVSVLAEQRGMTATFMPKPFGDRTGSGLHMHMSLWHHGSPVFPNAADPRGLGLSTVAYHFLGGVIEHAPALLAVVAPTVNSYKRTTAVSTASGATWAPRSATYGGNDRTHLVRVPDGNRIEIRVGDGSANPYLAMAAALAAGLDGMDREVDPGEPGGGIESAPLPPTLLHAVEELIKDKVVRGGLDAAAEGDPVSEYFAKVKREEFLTWHSQVTDWEVKHYLTAV